MATDYASPAQEPPWRTRLRRFQERFRRESERNERIACVLVHVADRHQGDVDLPDGCKVDGLKTAGGEVIVQAETSLRTPRTPDEVSVEATLDADGKPIANTAGDPFIVELGFRRIATFFGAGRPAYSLIAEEAGKFLAKLPDACREYLWKNLQRRLRYHDYEAMWTTAVFELAWFNNASGFSAAKRNWSYDQVLDLTQQHAVTKPKPISESETAWYSVLTNLFDASIDAIDVLLAIDTAKADELKGKSDRQETSAAEPASRVSPPDTTRIHDALIELQIAILSVQDYADDEGFEWLSIKDAVERVRAALAVTEHLSAVVHPSEQRQLVAMLDEIREIYHLESSDPIVGPPSNELARKIKAAIWKFAPAREAAGDNSSQAVVEAGDREQAEPGTTTDTVECFVTLLQMAAIVNKSKRTLERLRDNSKLAAPAVKGGQGKADEWRWSDVRPILEHEFRRQLPDVFPSDRFLRR